MPSISKTNKDIIYQNLINLPQVIFEVTDICNLHCKYCGLGELYDKCDVREGKMLPFENVKTTLNFLLKIWQRNYTPGVINPISVSFYGGEPLLNMPIIKKTIEFLEKSKDVGKRFFYSMTTNALILDKHIDYIVEKNFRLLISLDGDKKGQCTDL